jgi:hypothetical protein
LYAARELSCYPIADIISVLSTGFSEVFFTFLAFYLTGDGGGNNGIAKLIAGFILQY